MFIATINFFFFFLLFSDQWTSYQQIAAYQENYSQVQEREKVSLLVWSKSNNILFNILCIAMVKSALTFGKSFVRLNNLRTIN